MKDKILLILKIVGIIIFFPFVALFWLASVLVNSVIRRRDKALVEKPLGQYVDVDIHRMSVLVKGQGKHTLVFLPGLASISPILEFKPLYSLLEDDFRIVVPEKFGYGQSDIVKENRDYTKIVEQYRKAFAVLGIEGPFIFCAHSLGGNEVEIWAQDHPEEVEAFVGIDANLANGPCNWDEEWSYKHWKLDAFYTNILRAAGWCRNDLRPRMKELLSNEELRLMKALNSEKYCNFDVYSEEHNKLAANELINARPMPTQPTLQFVDAPEGYANGEKGDIDEYDEAFIKARIDFVAASVHGKIVFYDCDHCLHCFKYESMAKEIKKFVSELN